MTAVIYARYSSDNQREESIEGQIRECTAYAEKNGVTIVKHYIDRAISAKTDNRPEFQQMIKDSDKKLFDIVLVWKLDRFARNRYDSARYKTQLKKNGVKLMSATEIISEGPEGIILESVLEGYAEYYSADLAEKVVRGQTENILKGRCNGGRGTFGYTLDSERKFHIDPLASPFVLESFTKYRDGLTMKEIRDWLNENGIKNPVGGAFTYNSVEHMLKNRRYIGELKFRDVVVPDAIPPIVPLELFDDVQEKIAKNKKAPARRKAEDDYLLTTKLHCGCCGALMFGESGTSRTGEVHRYYKCATVKKSANSGSKIWWSTRPCSLSGTMPPWNPSLPRSWSCKTGRTPIFPSMRSSSGMRNRVSRICSTRFRPESSLVPPRSGWSSSKKPSESLKPALRKKSWQSPRSKRNLSVSG